MKTFGEIKDFLFDLSDDELKSLWNCYCGKVSFSVPLYEMCRFNAFMEDVKPFRLSEMIYYGSFCPNNPYFTFNNAGNLISGYADALVDVNVLAHYIVNNKDYLENKQLLDFCFDEDEGYRICSECGKHMYEGYCVDNGVEYYCSDECLHKHYTEEEWNEMYSDDGDSYWTTWYD